MVPLQILSTQHNHNRRDMQNIECVVDKKFRNLKCCILPNNTLSVSKFFMHNCHICKATKKL